MRFFSPLTLRSNSRRKEILSFTTNDSPDFRSVFRMSVVSYYLDLCQPDRKVIVSFVLQVGEKVFSIFTQQLHSFAFMSSILTLSLSASESIYLQSLLYRAKRMGHINNCSLDENFTRSSVKMKVQRDHLAVHRTENFTRSRSNSIYISLSISRTFSFCSSGSHQKREHQRCSGDQKFIHMG